MSGIMIVYKLYLHANFVKKNNIHPFIILVLNVEIMYRPTSQCIIMIYNCNGTYKIIHISSSVVLFRRIQYTITYINKTWF